MLATGENIENLFSGEAVKEEELGLEAATEPLDESKACDDEETESERAVPYELVEKGEGVNKARRPMIERPTK